jgi:hypothetical protein
LLAPPLGWGARAGSKNEGRNTSHSEGGDILPLGISSELWKVHSKLKKVSRKLRKVSSKLRKVSSELRRLAVN